MLLVRVFRWCGLENELYNLRKKIDGIDGDLVSLLRKRMDAVRQVADYKKKQGLGITDLAREKAVIKAWKQKAAAAGLEEDFIEALAQEVISFSKSLEGRHKVAVLGPAGTFSEDAARKYFGAGVLPLFQPSIYACFSAVEKGLAEYAVVPVENNVEGAVNATEDLLVSSDLKIVSELYLPISYVLAANPKADLSKIKRVHGNPQALAQCRKFLETNYPVEQVQSASNAQAIQALAEDSEAVAVGTNAAVLLYDANVVATGIQDYKENSTRFLVVGKELPKSASKAGKYKTSLVFTVKHKPGALFRALKAFSDDNINLTKIESRPEKGKKWEYLFFCDFEGNVEDAQIARALKKVKNNTDMLKVVSSYPMDLPGE